MKLRDLMDAAFDETMFRVVTPDGEERYFWNADYLGWHPDIMPDLEPLLDFEIEEFETSAGSNPDCADRRPSVLVRLFDKGHGSFGRLGTTEEDFTSLVCARLSRAMAVEYARRVAGKISRAVADDVSFCAEQGKWGDGDVGLAIGRVLAKRFGAEA